jgi:hypothetical protein
MTDPRWQTLPEATRIRWIRVLDDFNPISLTPLSRIALRTLAVQGNADGLAPLTTYALEWHDWGFTPDDWWMLMSAHLGHAHRATQLGVVNAPVALAPADWARWPSLSIEVAPLEALAQLTAAGNNQPKPD